MASKTRRSQENLERTAPINTSKPWLSLGRKATYNLAKAKRLCGYISLGYSLRKACEQEGMPSCGQVYEWKRKYPDFAQMFEEAQFERGLTLGDKIGDVAEQVLSGEVEPNAGRVAIDAYKFTAARLASRTWGERQTVEINTNISIKAALEEAQSRVIEGIAYDKQDSDQSDDD